MSQFPVDLVVTYVDNTDLIWQNAISQYNVESMPVRFRNWNIFKYWFRGVEKYMPWIRNIYLVVSNIEQVPNWINQDKVHIILHRDIIPEQLLPTFNSTTIEMYLCKIPGLAEHFIYSNDDMLPINNTSVDDFFTKDGLPVYELVHRSNAKRTFRLQCKNSYKLSAKLTNYKNDNVHYFYIRHSMSPLLKSYCDDIHVKAGDEIFKRCTKFREPWNFTQYLFSDYILMNNNAVLDKMNLLYVTVKDSNLINLINTSTAKIICINDANTKNFSSRYNTLQMALRQKYPQSSIFEIG